MEGSLFNKHKNLLHQRKSSKEEIISYIQEHTGININEEDITLSKKEVQLHTSSTVRQNLFQKGVKELLARKGFILK